MAQRRDSYQSLTDKELIQRYRFSHDISYMKVLFDRYLTPLTIICLKYQPEKAQCSQALKDLFDLMCGELKKHNVKVFDQWMLKLTLEHCQSFQMTKSSSTVVTEPLGIKETKVPNKNNSANFDDHQLVSKFLKEQKLGNLEQGMRHLPDKQKKCIELYYFKEKKYNEIATITGFTLNEVKSYIQNGNRNLRIYLEEENG